MLCPPVQRDNPRALASTGEQTVLKLFYTTPISVDLAQYEIFRAKVKVCFFLARVV